jgi:sugar O-acyltransferase (sialic acid O-acetyltransferase NeuD family)
MNHIVIGTGGLAKQALPTFDKEYPITFFVNTYTEKEEFYGYPIVSSKENFSKTFTFSICIGDPKWRKNFYEEMSSIGGYPLNTFGSYNLIMEDNIGEGNMFLNYVLVELGCKIGNGNLFNCYSSIFHDVEIGDFNEIMPGAKILGGAKIGSSCRIGTNSTILPKINICDNTIIGAGAVVTKDINEPGTYVGIPAKRIT